MRHSTAEDVRVLIVTDTNDVSHHIVLELLASVVEQVTIICPG